MSKATKTKAVAPASGEPPVPTIKSLLREYLLTGRTPEEAASTVLDPYGGVDSDPLCAFVWPVVLRTARDMELELAHETRQSVFFSNSTSETARARAIALPRTVYHMPNGKEVLWDDLTVDLIDLKIAHLRTQIGGLVDHIMVLEAARKLLVSYGATQLSEIPGWVDLVREDIAREIDPDGALAAAMGKAKADRRKAKVAKVTAIQAETVQALEPAVVAEPPLRVQITVAEPAPVPVPAPAPVKPHPTPTPAGRRRRRVVPEPVSDVPVLRKRRAVTAI